MGHSVHELLGRPQAADALVTLGQGVLYVMDDGGAQHGGGVEHEEDDEEVLDAGREDEFVELLRRPHQVEARVDGLGAEVCPELVVDDVRVRRRQEVRLQRRQEVGVGDDVELAAHKGDVGVLLVPTRVRPVVAQGGGECTHPFF